MTEVLEVHGHPDPMAGSSSTLPSVIVSARETPTWYPRAFGRAPERPRMPSITVGVERRAPGRRAGRRRRSERRAARGERVAEADRQLRRVAVATLVHVHDLGGHLVEAVVDGGHAQSALEESRHDGRDLLLAQDEVSMTMAWSAIALKAA